jgi:hypothetical protein
MGLPEKSILLLSIEDCHEAEVLRAFSEQLFLRVEMYGIGESKDVVQLLNGGHQTDLIVLACHGKDGNIVMPEVGEGLKAKQPFPGNMRPEHVREFLKLDGQRVFSTGCATGTPEMAAAFLDAGCDCYLAPTDYQDGTASLVFAVNFLYHYLSRGSDVENAVSIARREDDESRFFRLYTQERS